MPGQNVQSNNMIASVNAAAAASAAAAHAAAAATPSGATEHTIRVSCLPSHLTDDQVRELLSAFGALKKFSLPKAVGNPTQNVGYALVEYEVAEVTDVAVSSLNGLEICGRALEVKREPVALSGPPGGLNLTPVAAAPPTAAAKPEPARLYTLELRGLATAELLADEGEYQTILAEVEGECSELGDVHRVVLARADASCTVAFAHLDDARRCRKALHGRKYDGRLVEAVPQWDDEAEDEPPAAPTPSGASAAAVGSGLPPAAPPSLPTPLPSALPPPPAPPAPPRPMMAGFVSAGVQAGTLAPAAAPPPQPAAVPTAAVPPPAAPAAPVQLPGPTVQLPGPTAAASGPSPPEGPPPPPAVAIQQYRQQLEVQAAQQQQQLQQVQQAQLQAAQAQGQQAAQIVAMQQAHFSQMLQLQQRCRAQARTHPHNHPRPPARLHLLRIPAPPPHPPAPPPAYRPLRPPPARACRSTSK